MYFNVKRHTIRFNVTIKYFNDYVKSDIIVCKTGSKFYTRTTSSWCISDTVHRKIARIHILSVLCESLNDDKKLSIVYNDAISESALVLVVRAAHGSVHLARASAFGQTEPVNILWEHFRGIKEGNIAIRGFIGLHIPGRAYSSTQVHMYSARVMWCVVSCCVLITRVLFSFDRKCRGARRRVVTMRFFALVCCSFITTI